MNLVLNEVRMPSWEWPGVNFYSLCCLLFAENGLGACNKIHDPALRADYENAAQTREFGYDVDVSINVKEEVVTLKKKQVS